LQPLPEGGNAGREEDASVLSLSISSLVVVFLPIDMTTGMVLLLLDPGSLFGREVAIRLGFGLLVTNLSLLSLELSDLPPCELAVVDAIENALLLVSFSLVNAGLRKGQVSSE
jgi:hypothetical protein